jgi:hypothetical protein
MARALAVRALAGGNEVEIVGRNPAKPTPCFIWSSSPTRSSTPTSPFRVSIPS